MCIRDRISHPTGNQNVRNALRSLVEHEMLAEFWTTIAWNPESRWNRVVPSSLRGQLVRRAFGDVPGDRVRCVPWREMVRLGARFSPLERLLCSGERAFSVIGMYRNFDAMVARRLGEIGANAVYAYEGGALQTFRQAKRRGIRTLYDLTSGYWYWERDLLREEQARSPHMASVLPKLSDSVEHMREKDEEIALADLIVVASDHVRRTLVGVVPEDKMCIRDSSWAETRLRLVMDIRLIQMLVGSEGESARRNSCQPGTFPAATVTMAQQIGRRAPVWQPGPAMRPCSHSAKLHQWGTVR